MAISYVNDSEFSGNGSSFNYTLNRPSGVTSGDLMVAVVALDISPENSNTINPPSGWTTVDTVFSGPYCLFQVMTRMAGGSEPSSWTGSLQEPAVRRVSVVATYRGASGIGSTDSRTRGQATSVSTGSVTNGSSLNWRVTCGAYMSSTTNYALTSNDNVERRDATSSGSGAAVEVAICDSNGTINTGSTSRTYSRGAIWESAGAWIGILEASSGTIPGDLEVDLPLLQVSMEAEMTNTGSVDADLPLLEMDAEGIASPPEGDLDAVITPTVSVDAVHEGSGTVDTEITPSVEMVGETRQFGIRVISPEAENRVVTPRLGAST